MRAAGDIAIGRLRQLQRQQGAPARHAQDMAPMVVGGGLRGADAAA